ncbi:MAG: tyrosine-type recombinase/integrase [Phycisphaerae bacterium]|nr:tyrosine-type recombinase/integrase [Phycisphaerae bacterium]
MRWMRKRGKVKRRHNIGLSKILYGEDFEAFRDYVTADNADSLRGKRRKMICDLMINTGLRECEVCALRVMDTPIVLHKPAISVFVSKNDKDRDVAISKRLANTLVSYIKNIRPKTLPRHIRRQDINQPVFFSQQKRQYTTAGLYYLIRTAGEKAGIEKRVKPHMLRHTYATNALASGMTTRDVQSQLGHSDIRMTEIYTHMLNDNLLEKANKTDRDFSSRTSLFQRHTKGFMEFS